jgi:hypothetical protein
MGLIAKAVSISWAAGEQDERQGGSGNKKGNDLHVGDYTDRKMGF